MQLAQNPNELTLLYNSNSVRGKKTLAYANTVCKNIKRIEFNQIKLTNTIWKELLNMLGLKPKEILDKSHPDYQEKLRGHAYTKEGWLNIIRHNPHLIKAPIALRNKKAILCTRVKDVLKLVK